MRNMSARELRNKVERGVELASRGRRGGSLYRAVVADCARAPSRDIDAAMMVAGTKLSGSRVFAVDLESERIKTDRSRRRRGVALASKILRGSTAKERQAAAELLVRWGGHNELAFLADRLATFDTFGLVVAVMDRLEQQDTRVLDILMRLTADDSSEVRNWATFAAGDLVIEFRHRITNPQSIIDCLWKRVDDEHSETRAEAVSGLARWGVRTPRLTRCVERGLGEDPLFDHYIEAAALLASSKLCAALRRASGVGLDDSRQRIPIRDALHRCRCRSEEH